MEIYCQGRGVLCFVTPNALWFQGYFIDLKGAHYGLMGVEKPIDECVQCADGGYKEYHVTVTNFETNSHRNCIVAKSGGNCCRLTLLSELDEEIIFETTEFICDTNAKEAVRRYFPAIMQRVNDSNDETDLLHDCVVCYGDMKIRKLALQPLD